MQYTPIHSLSCDFCIYEQNRLPGRSFFLPFSNEEAALSVPYYRAINDSDMSLCLDGDWDFMYYASYHSLEVLDTDKCDFDTLRVPSVWQTEGVEAPFYVNVKYQFKPNPPRIPDSYSLGVYRKLFVLEHKSYKHILTFLGVAPCMSLYVNGKYIGYGEGSHNTSEFDVTDALIEGENEIVVFVYKYCNGTYLEAQDMFRSNGIFRSVYLTKLCKNFIYDFRVKTTNVATGTYDLAVHIDADERETGAYRARLLDNGACIAEGDIDVSTGDITFSGLSVREWTAETPNLYTLVLLTVAEGEVCYAVTKRIGFRTIQVDGERFLVNGTPIKILGVNHHDTHPVRGYAMTYEDMLLDVKLMKDLNVNAVRTSHYPPHPYFLELAAEYGLYIIDEADIETHGMMYYCRPAKLIFCGINAISNDASWATHYVDRVMRMYERDKNNVCIIMWSLGNESGGYKNHDICCNRLHEVSDIPVHYEGVSRTCRWAYDVISEMYPSRSKIQAIGDRVMPKKFYGKPYFMCEYAHAMGVGPGGLWNYVETFLRYDNLLGGCIWEWADHAAYKVHPKYEFSYGGDHGEHVHDGNFCCDGIVSPMREYEPSAYYTKVAYSPLRFYENKGQFIAWNIKSFTGTDEYDIEYDILIEGKSVRRGKLQLDIEPRTKRPFDLAVPEKSTNVHVNFTVKDRDGHTISVQQVELSTGIAAPIVAKKNITWSVEDSAETIIISSSSAQYVFNKALNLITSISEHREQYLRPIDEVYSRGITPSVWRAPVDNDRNLSGMWKKVGYYCTEYSNHSAKVITGEDGSIKLATSCVAKRKSIKLFGMSVIYHFLPTGSVDVSVRLNPYTPLLRDFPKLGLILPLNGDISTIEYFGRGNVENFSDIREHTPVGIFTASKDSMAYPYIMPQESGNRSDVRYAKLTDCEGHGIVITAKSKLLNINLTPYTLTDMTESTHREDLVHTDTAFLYVDGFMSGIGTGSCGPRAEEQYRISPKKPLEYVFTLDLI